MSGGSFEPLTTCGAALKSDLYERKQSYFMYVAPLNLTEYIQRKKRLSPHMKMTH